MSIIKVVSLLVGSWTDGAPEFPLRQYGIIPMQVFLTVSSVPVVEGSITVRNTITLSHILYLRT